MYQFSKAAPVAASPGRGSSEKTNTFRYNSQATSGSSEDFKQEPDQSASMQRLNQVVSNFHTKAALIILHSRAELSPAFSAKTNERRVNKWFNIELDETDDYLDDIRPWKKLDVQVERPPPLIIETYLAPDPLPQGQRLVIVDEDQKRQDVYNALESGKARPKSRSSKGREIILERWSIELGAADQPIPADLAAVLPHVYKKSIVVFRALYTYCNFLPAWKLMRKLGRSRTTMGLKLHYRIVAGDKLDSISRADNLTTPLFESNSPTTTEYSFGSTESPAGPFSVHVQYRTNCDFRVEETEELLSSNFIGADHDLFRPLPKDSNQPLSSLPSDPRQNLLERPELGHAYGSMSTFHQVGINTSTSPISALRAQKDYGDSPSPQRPLPQQAQRTLINQRKSSSTSTRRSSFSIQPFKAPTLAASPISSSPLSGSPRVSTRVVPTLGSLEEEPTQDPRTHVVTNTENTLPSSTSSSPRPAPIPRFQSSFGHRKNRLSIDRTPGKNDDDQTSSGKASAASSAQPGSGLMLDPGRDGSSGSLQGDDENISDFLKMLDQKKDLLNPSSSAALESSTRRTAAALSKFHKMRDSNAALSESMSSSLMVQKSSAAPGRGGTSTSPKGKPVSPHTQHVPFAPSRLSAAYSHDDQQNLANSMDADGNTSPSEQVVDPISTAEVGAIDIPNSPLVSRPTQRAHSLQRRRLPSDEDIAGLYARRPSSVGAGLPEPKATDAELRRQDAPTSDSESGRSASLTQYQNFARQRSPTQGSLSSIGGTGASVGKVGDSSQNSWQRRPAVPRPEMQEDDTEEMPFIMDQSTMGKRF